MTRGNKNITKESLQNFIAKLAIPESDKKILLNLSPFNYTGIATKPRKKNLMTTILVLYYSKEGAVKAMAQAIALGINSINGVEAKIRTVPDVYANVEEKKILNSGYWLYLCNTR